ncbi:MAG: YlxR family protein [Erysipelotrichaceae bacterium]|jgi:predicted RNA-binding protein YlxR (DUF448 family)|nr:YlxR family protein [Erysipelotrichaceae bacterium]
MRKTPMRKCLATNEMLPKKDLIRIVRSPEGVVFIDEIGKANGRGAYLKKDPDAVSLARKTGCLQRALKVVIPDEIYAKLNELAKK